MNLMTAIQIYLWALIIVCFLAGVTMMTLITHKKHAPENAEATEKWINIIQTGFWSFVLVMALIGVIMMWLMLY